MKFRQTMQIVSKVYTSAIWNINNSQRRNWPPKQFVYRNYIREICCDRPYVFYIVSNLKTTMFLMWLCIDTVTRWGRNASIYIKVIYFFESYFE